jgi:hypothetical protein
MIFQNTFGYLISEIYPMAVSIGSVSVSDHLWRSSSARCEVDLHDVITPSSRDRKIPQILTLNGFDQTLQWNPSLLLQSDSYVCG